MGASYSRMANSDAAQNILMGAGVLARHFDPETGTASDIFGITTGGITFATNPTYEDWASDADQLPNNMKEFRIKSGEDPTMSGTYIEVNGDRIRDLMGSGTRSTVKAGTAGSYTVTITTALASGDAVKVAGVSYEYDSGDTSAADQATAIAAAITADTGNYYSATASSAVITLAEKAGHYGAGQPEVETAFLTTGKVTVATTTAGVATTYKITPNANLSDSDFGDVWLICDKSGGGFVAIRLINALNTTGFQIKTTKDSKGNHSFEYHGHYSLADTETPPYEIFYRD